MRLLLALAFAVALRADVVVLKNGDRATGTVVKKEGATLTIKTAQFGAITVPWVEVESVTTETPLTLELSNGDKVQGPVTTSGGQFQVGGRSFAPADIKTLRNAAEQAAYERMLHPGIGRLWAGTATLGWAGTTGNAQTSTFSVGMNAARATNSGRTTAYFNAVKASAFVNGTRSDTAQAVRGGWGYSRNIAKRVFLNTFNDWENDRFQALDLRITMGAGLGLSAWKGESGRLDLPFGLAWSYAKFDPAPQPSFIRRTTDGYWGDEFQYKFASRITITQSFRMFDAINDGGRTRVNLDLGIATQVFKWLSWNVSASDRYQSSPAAGRKTNDLLYTTGIGVNFAR